MEDSPQDLPLKQSGEEESTERKPPRNRTPLFKLSAVLPEFAAEARRVLIRWGETALANQVDDLWIYDRCLSAVGGGMGLSVK